MIQDWRKPNPNTPALSGDAEGIPSICLVRIDSLINTSPISGLPPNVNTPNNLKYACTFMSSNGPIKVTTANAIQPSVPREPDTMLVQGFTTGQILPGGVLDGTFLLLAAERPYYGPCTPPGS